ncbi:MAG TPA: LysR family transcriptional regulator, partial [Dorea longicatena]|nr:LysR family transcriptional regulator [Dorea longicatena]
LCIQELDEPDLVTKILLIWAKGKKPVPLVQEFLDVCGEH